MGIDVGTSGCKTAVFDLDGNTAAYAGREYPLICPAAGAEEAVCRTCRSQGYLAQIDTRIRGKDISGSHIYLCHNDKSFDGCCISGSKSGMILP